MGNLEDDLKKRLDNMKEMVVTIGGHFYFSKKQLFEKLDKGEDRLFCKLFNGEVKEYTELVGYEQRAEDPFMACDYEDAVYLGEGIFYERKHTSNKSIVLEEKKIKEKLSVRDIFIMEEKKFRWIAEDPENRNEDNWYKENKNLSFLCEAVPSCYNCIFHQKCISDLDSDLTKFYNSVQGKKYGDIKLYATKIANYIRTKI